MLGGTLLLSPRTDEIHNGIAAMPEGVYVGPMV